MRILSVTAEPLTRLPFLNAGRGAGGFYVDHLPVQVAIVDELPDGLAAIIATSDLQGRENRFDGQVGGPRLLGEVLPQILVDEVLPQLSLPPGEIGVCLAGDFYTAPTLDRLGASGDVTDVWRAFGNTFEWVVGVAGNHDSFGPKLGTRPRFSHNLHYLDGETITVSNLAFAGMGGIVGNPSRPWRRTEEQYLQVLTWLLQRPTDLLLMHDGPDLPSRNGRGSAAVRRMLEQHRPRLVVRGHAHWDEPLGELAGGTQVLNVDGRVVVLRR